MRRRRFVAIRALAFATVASAGVALSGCSLTAGVAGSTGDPGGAEPLAGTATVIAAASLTEVFDRLAAEFEKEHPAVDVVTSYGASSALAQQIRAGAPVDVFAAASEDTMSSLTEAGLVAGLPVTFATNTLAIAVPPGNPAGVTGLADLADPERTIAVCAEEAPCGAVASQLFEGAGIEPSVDTFEEDVKAVLTKVELGEVDAGLVYRTDVRAAGDQVEGVDVPEAAHAVSRYPIAVLRDAGNTGAGSAFVELVTGPIGRRALTEAGFGAP